MQIHNSKQAVSHGIIYIMFKFLDYNFNPDTYQAFFRYQGTDGIIFTEKITFANNLGSFDKNNFEILDRALFLAWILIGTSYYKAHPTSELELSTEIDNWQANFFNHVYQEGLSQFAFENNLTREDLAHFQPVGKKGPTIEALTLSLPYEGKGNLVLQSGGKDSLLVGKLLENASIDSTPWYAANSPAKVYPSVIDSWKIPPEITVREIDLANLRKSGGLNGHVPVTYINESLALIQAILNHKNTVIVSIAQEGNEAHAQIGDLAVNHQWSKSWQAEQLLAEYVAKYISPDLHVGSPLRKYSELRVAELFVKNCWQDFGTEFSSCNRANYQQGQQNEELTWCADCAKCANSYLLFCPFLPAEQLQTIFGGEELFEKPSLTDIYKGLLGIDGFIKPFECVGTVDELRKAYELRGKDYASLPFEVPTSNFDYLAEYPAQDFFAKMF